jgi:hypothetical protein
MIEGFLYKRACIILNHLPDAYMCAMAKLVSVNQHIVISIYFCRCGYVTSYIYFACFIRIIKDM